MWSRELAVSLLCVRLTGHYSWRLLHTWDLPAAHSWLQAPAFQPIVLIKYEPRVLEMT